jgi:imidazolonepropionase-like amidohydrolase
MADKTKWDFAIKLAALVMAIAVAMPAQAARKKSAEFQSPATVLLGGTLIDGRGGPVLENSAIIIRNKKIIAVGPAKDTKTPKGVRVISIHGKTVLPGLIDAHVHIDGSGGGSREPGEFGPRAVANNLRSYLKYGVTTVFDMAGNPFIDAQKQALSTGQMIGPRLFGVKYGLTAPNGHPLQMLKKTGRLAILGPVYYTIANEAQIGSALAHILADNADGVKIIHSGSGFPIARDAPKLSPQLLKVVIDRAHAKDLRVFVHVASPADAREAVAAGADALTNSITLGDAGPELFAFMAKRKIAYMPALSRIEAIYNIADDPNFTRKFRGKIWGPVLDNYFTEKSLVLEGLITPGVLKAARRALATAMNNLRRAVRAGVPVVLGTDAGNPGALHGASVPREMMLMNQSGMTQMEIITAATSLAAKVIGKGKLLGAVEKGKIADLLILNADPRGDIRRITDIWRVVRGGYILDPRGIPFE